MAAENVALTSVTISGITVAGIEWLKHSRYFPWITKEKILLIRAISAVAAAAAAVGITYTWNAADHSLTIAGLTLGGMATFFWAWAKQMTMNELVRQATKGSSNPAVVKAVAPQAAVPDKS